MPSALISNLALASVETLNSTIAGKETIRARVVRGFVKRERNKKKRKAVGCKLRSTVHSYIFQLSKNFEIWYPAECVHLIKNIVTPRVKISIQSGDPSNESKIEQFHLGAALRNDVYWPWKREERDRGDVERLRVFFFFFLFWTTGNPSKNIKEIEFFLIF